MPNSSQRANFLIVYYSNFFRYQISIDRVKSSNTNQIFGRHFASHSHDKKMEDWLSKNTQLCIEIQKYSLKTEIHKCRSATLAKRIKTLMDTIASSPPNTYSLSDLRTKSCLGMLSTALEEIRDFLKMLQKVDKTLGKRVNRYGSDEESFMKWNETLATCSRELKVTVDFDQDVDLQDFNKDMEDLSIKLTVILEKVLHLFGSVELAVEANQKLLAQQQSDRTQFKTQRAVKADNVFDVKRIKYEKIIGRGGKSSLLMCRIWSCLAG